jgi:MFS transporter, DHA1 family, tetracycline resistance protein
MSPVKKAKVAVSSKLEGRAMPIVLLTIFLDVIGVSMLFPVLPQLIYKVFIPAGYSFKGSLIMLAWLTGIFALMQFAATPILGQLSDRYGRKKLLAISLIGTSIGYSLFAIAIITKNIPLLFFSRILDGITGGNISVARAVIADVSLPEHRTRNFGLIGAVFGMGFVMGPYIGARLATPGASFFGLFHTPTWFSASTPFWFTTALALLAALLVLFVLPETHKHINSKLRLTWNKSLQNIRQAATNPALRVIFGAEFMFWGGFTFFTTFFQIVLIEKLGFKVNNVGDFFAYIGICIALTQGLLTPLVAKRLKNYEVLRFSLIGNGIALFLQLLPHNTAQLLLVSPFIAIFNGLTMANASALVSLSAGRENQGEVLGIEASVQALAQGIPAIIAGYVATMGIYMPVVVGGSVVLLGGILFNIFYRPSKQVVGMEAADVRAAAH